MELHSSETSATLWPIGCVVFFNIPAPSGGLLSEKILEARSSKQEGSFLHIYNEAGKCICMLCIRNIVVVTEPRTVGPAGAPNADN